MLCSGENDFAEDYIDIEGTRLIFKISRTRTDLTACLSWQNIVLGRRFDSHRGQEYFFSLSGVDIDSE